MANGQDGTLTKPGKFYRYTIEIQRQFMFNSSTAEHCANLQCLADDLPADGPTSRALFEQSRNALGLAVQPIPAVNPPAITAVADPEPRLCVSCGANIDDLPADAERCVTCIKARIAQLQAAQQPKAPAVWKSPAKCPVKQQSPRNIAQANQCPHGFKAADCPMCNGNQSVDVGF